MKSLLLMLLAAGAMQAAPTYTKDIAPILFANCVSCHRPGQVAPFSLLSYGDAKKRAALIGTVTTSRYMPPWKAEPGYGHFEGERRLPDADIQLIAAWMKAGAPEGNPKDLPAQPVFKSGWSAGEPDLKLTMATESAVPAAGQDQYRCFVLPYQSDTEKFLQSLEFQPGNAKIVHHALVYADTSGKAKELDAATPEPGYSCFGGVGFPPAGLLGGWAPGSTPRQYSDGLAITVPAKADLVLQLHYHPSGKPETDKSSIGLRFTGPPTHGLTSIITTSRKIDIPAGDSHYEVKTSLVVPEDVKAIGITPHAHYLCKEMKVTAQLPDGTSTPLIWIKDWDFNWQGQYTFADPITLPKGTRVSLDYVYDNSAANPHNPSSPPKRVTYGEQTTDEMALAFVIVTLPDPAQVATFRREMFLNIVDQMLSEGTDLDEIGEARAARIRPLIKMFDRNQDGVLQPDEREALIKFLKQRIL